MDGRESRQPTLCPVELDPGDIAPDDPFRVEPRHGPEVSSVAATNLENGSRRREETFRDRVEFVDRELVALRAVIARIEPLEVSAEKENQMGPRSIPGSGAL